MPISKDQLYKRFDKYAKMNTQSDENSKTYPSTQSQLELGKILAQELKDIGVTNVNIDKFGYVTGEIPSTSNKKSPTIAFLAHMDTAPDLSGENVDTQIHKNYTGGDIIISKEVNRILKPSESKELKACRGHDIVTASGNSLLGADDKAGISIIMNFAEELIKNPVPHGKIKIAFTPDEEVGAGVEHFDVKTFGADFAYTIDGDVLGTIEDENFNADGLTIKIKRRN